MNERQIIIVIGLPIILILYRLWLRASKPRQDVPPSIPTHPPQEKEQAWQVWAREADAFLFKVEWENFWKHWAASDRTANDEFKARVAGLSGRDRKQALAVNDFAKDLRGVYKKTYRSLQRSGFTVEEAMKRVMEAWGREEVPRAVPGQRNADTLLACSPEAEQEKE